MHDPMCVLYKERPSLLLSPSQDDVPELEEVFLVELTSVTLLDADTTGIPPSLGVNTIAEVIVAPNDSPQGVISFAQET